MLIYICHPFGGKCENRINAEKIILDLMETRPEFTYVSPIHTFGFTYFRNDYETGMFMCLDLLAACDAMYVYGDHKSSRGCTIEIKFASKIPHLKDHIYYPEKGEYFTPRGREGFDAY